MPFVHVSCAWRVHCVGLQLVDVGMWLTVTRCSGGGGGSSGSGGDGGGGDRVRGAMESMARLPHALHGMTREASGAAVRRPLCAGPGRGGCAVARRAGPGGANSAPSLPQRESGCVGALARGGAVTHGALPFSPSLAASVDSGAASAAPAGALAMPLEARSERSGVPSRRVLPVDLRRAIEGVSQLKLTHASVAAAAEAATDASGTAPQASARGLHGAALAWLHVGPPPARAAAVDAAIDAAAASAATARSEPSGVPSRRVLPVDLRRAIVGVSQLKSTPAPVSAAVVAALVAVAEPDASGSVTPASARDLHGAALAWLHVGPPPARAAALDAAAAAAPAAAAGAIAASLDGRSDLSAVPSRCVLPLELRHALAGVSQVKLKHAPVSAAVAAAAATDVSGSATPGSVRSLQGDFVARLASRRQRVSNGQFSGRKLAAARGGGSVWRASRARVVPHELRS